MQVRIPHLTEHDADRIAAQLEREPVQIRRPIDQRERTPRRRHHNPRRHAA